MAISLFDNLPAVLHSVQTKLLFVMRLGLRELQVVRTTPGAYRRVGVVPSGVFEGDRLSGEVLDGGSDWQNVRSDASTTLDVRLVLKTTDDVLVGMTCRGVRQGPSETTARLEKGEIINPAGYYFRIAPPFETEAPQYAWLNNIVAIGIGHRLANGPVYSVFEVLSLGCPVTESYSEGVDKRRNLPFGKLASWH